MSNPGAGKNGAGDTQPEKVLPLLKKDIEKLISQNSSRITFAAQNEAKRSKVWKSFQQILVDLTKTDFVKCNFCSTEIFLVGNT